MRLQRIGKYQWVVAAIATALLGALPAAAQTRPKPTEITTEELKISQPAVRGNTDQLQVLVELKAPGAAEVYKQTMAATVGPVSSQAIAHAISAAQAQFHAIEAAQRQVADALVAPAIGANEIFRVRRALNAISVYTTRDKIAAIKALPGVKAVHIVQPEYPTNSTSVPFIGAPQVWTDTLGLGKDITGAGVKIGIIDTGIDYIHANFGGDGQSATYTAAAAATSNFTTLGGGFPSAKVVGGYDFAGDLYDGGNSPVPDDNPMDCGGHGSHVAGTAAGYGVKSDNSTFFPGPYNASDPFGSLKIGPGVAPLADLYSLRVFGCGGSTGLTVQAIDWAMDPNNDGDMSDHLDVINMSLGSGFGRLSDTSGMASDAAAAIGVVVVCAAGNKGDTFFITDSPGTAARAISVAASIDPGGSDGAQLTVNSPVSIAGDYLAAAASFGPALTPAGVTGNVVLANDGSGSPTLGCNSSPTWPGMSGNVALIDRGTCTFVVKVKNAQLNGAIGVIVANTSVGVFGGMGGSDPTITIPSLMITYADGNTVKTAMGSGTVNATLKYGSFPTYADTLASFSSRGPVANAPVFLKPDLTAPGQNITSTLTGWTCDGVTITGCIFPTGVSGNRINPNSQAGVLSGTSMACPHMAGTMALLRQLHPDWSVEELKALAMNTALNNVTTGPSGSGLRYGPDRIGTGREDVPLAAQNNTAAFNADDVGQVSVSFGTEVVGSLTATKTVRVDNKGLTSRSYTLGIETVEDNPGASFSLPGGTSLTVPAGTSTTFTVRLSATAGLLTHTVDPTVAPQQTGGSFGGTFPRHWLTEEAGYLTFSQGGVLKMRVPLFSAPVPASTMSGGPINTGGNPSGASTVDLSGSGVCTATHTAGPPETCTAYSLPTDEISLVSPFELQVAHPADPVNIAPYQNLQYAGVNYDSADNIMMFGVSTWGDWATPSDVSFTIYIDCGVADPSTGICTGAPDGNWDFAIVSSDFGSISRYLFGNSSYYPTDSFATFYWNLTAGSVGAANYINLLDASQQDTRLFNTNVMFIPVSPRRMGFGTTSGTTPRPFNYTIETCPGWAPACGAYNGFNIDSTGTFHFDPTNQGLDFGTDWLSNDLNGSSLPVTFNTANLATNGSLGGLLLHHHNGAGSRAQVVLLSPDGSAQGSDLALTASAAPGNPALNQNVVVTVHIVNNGPAAATGVTVTGTGSPSLQYVSDDGGGAFNSSTGVWTVGALANGGSSTLHITVKDTATGPASALLQITSSTPLDPNPANNFATVGINVAGQANLSITKTADNLNPPQLGNVTFTITVTNAGPDTAYNVVVTDLLNASFQFVSATPSAGSYNPVNGQWTFASLGIGATETLTLVAKVMTGGALTNTATVASATGDPSTGNNQAVLNFGALERIPLASPIGLLVLAALLALAGALALRRLS